MINERIDLEKVKNINDIAGSWIWKYGMYQNQYIWDRTKYKNKVVLINKNTNEEIKGFKNIMRYIKNNDLELERF
jgi:hypothetical protein